MKIPSWLKVYGDLSFRGECPKEDADLKSFFNQLRIHHPALAACAFHVENEGKRSFLQAQNAWAKGMLKGVSDIVIVGNPTLIIELKQENHTKSAWEKGQLEFLEASHKSGAYVCLALGFEAAWEALEDWIALQKNVQNNLF